MTEDNEFENHLRSFRPRLPRIELPSIDSATAPMQAVVQRPYGALLGSWVCGALVGAAAVLVVFQVRTQDKTELAISPTNVEPRIATPTTIKPTLRDDGFSDVAAPAVREMEIFLSNDDSMDDMPLVAHFSFPNIGGKFVANHERLQAITPKPLDIKDNSASSPETSSERDSSPSTRGSLMRQWVNDPSSRVF